MIEHVARTGLCNRVNAVMELLCRGGTGRLVWVLNDQCWLSFEEVFPRLEELRVRTVQGWADGDVDQWWVGARHPAAVVRAAAERVVRGMAGWDPAGPADALAIHGRWLDRVGGRRPGDYGRRVASAWPRLAGGAFLLTDHYAEEIARVLPWPVERQASAAMEVDRDRANPDAQRAFLGDLQRLWRAEVAVTNNSRTTIPDMRSYLGRPTCVAGSARRDDWVGRSGWWRAMRG